MYIYRSNRIIQSGGWSGLRTSDEHTKLVRIALSIPSQIEELFQVNVAKKLATLPRELRQVLQSELQPIIQQAQNTYREKGEEESINDPQSLNPINPCRIIPTILINKIAQKVGNFDGHSQILNLINAVVQGVPQEDAETFLKVLEKFIKS